MDFIFSIFNYLSTYVVIAGIYAIFSLGLNIHWGYTLDYIFWRPPTDI